MTRDKAQTLIVQLVAVLVFCNGLLALLRPLADRIPERFESILVPISYGDLTRSLDFVLGFILIYVSIQLWQRKFVAWLIAITVSWLLVIVSILHPHTDVTVLGPLLAGIALLTCHQYFTARSETRSIRQGILILIFSVVLVLAYGVLGFFLLGRHNLGVSLTLSEAFSRTFNAYFLLGNGDIVPLTHRAHWFLDSLNFLGFAAIGYGLFSIFRPLDYQYRTLPHERLLVAQLLKKYSRSSEDFFKLWPNDKSYFFSDSNDAVIAYGVEAGVAICLGDPVGEDSAIPRLIEDFQNFCLSHGWVSCFIYVLPEYVDLYRAAGLNTIKIGEDALIDVDTFTTQTMRDKHFRNINNRFEKAGYTAGWSDPPHSTRLLREIAEVSRAWATIPGRREWSFITGNSDVRYMQQSRLFITRDASNKIQAFVNEIPVYIKGHASIDLMRHTPDAPSNLMDFLFLRLIADLKDREITTFDLGLAPLSGLDEGESHIEEKLLNLVYRINQPFLSFKGLRQFKSKFDPRWEASFVAHSGSSARLPLIGLALSRITRASDRP
jgi:phosphatidylglycerol lysyltransferase